MTLRRLFQSTCLLAVMTGGVCFSATTLQFSNGGTGATNFADQNGTVTNGMRWGIIISSTNSTFNAGSYDPFDATLSGFLSVGGVATDDYYFATGTVTGPLGDPFFTGVEAGNGGISTANGVPSTGDLVPNVNGGDSFGIIWFASSTANENDYYGFMTDASFLLPSSGTVAFTSPFVGEDPIRSATFQFQAIPEPSRFLLIGLAGLVGIMRRRR
jgi:hypothetical protein